MADLATHDKLSALADAGFLRPKFFTPEHWAAIIQVGSFIVIIDGDYQASEVHTRNRWYYQNLSDAGRALQDWNGNGQPRDFISAKLMAELVQP